MNKEKVMKLAQQLAHVNYSNESHSKEFILEDIINELNSKPVMPKFFKEWDEDEHEKCSCYEDQIEDLLRIGISDDIPFDDTYFMSDVDNQIYLWLSNSNQDFRVSIHRFSKCIDAIRYGYEVSDNDK